MNTAYRYSPNVSAMTACRMAAHVSQREALITWQGLRTPSEKALTPATWAKAEKGEITLTDRDARFFALCVAVAAARARGDRHIAESLVKAWKNGDLDPMEESL